MNTTVWFSTAAKALGSRRPPCPSSHAAHAAGDVSSTTASKLRSSAREAKSNRSKTKGARQARATEQGSEGAREAKAREQGSKGAREQGSKQRCRDELRQRRLSAMSTALSLSPASFASSPSPSPCRLLPPSSLPLPPPSSLAACARSPSAVTVAAAAFRAIAAPLRLCARSLGLEMDAADAAPPDGIVEAKVLTARALTLRAAPLLPRAMPAEVLQGVPLW